MHVDVVSVGLLICSWFVSLTVLHNIEAFEEDQPLIMQTVLWVCLIISNDLMHFKHLG